MSQNLTKEVSEHMYSVTVRKSRYRSAVARKYNAMLSKVSPLNKSPEAKLRILRSYRLRLLHEYCHDVLKEAYGDSLCIQAL